VRCVVGGCQGGSCEVLILRAKIRCMRDHVTSRRSLVSSLDPQVTLQQREHHAKKEANGHLKETAEVCLHHISRIGQN
jgi:hypothetical protein